MDARKAPCPCGSGKRYKSCCYARDRARQRIDAARAVAAEGQRAVDEVLRVFLPLIESRGEHVLACKEGCHACCGNFVHVAMPEALHIAAWLGAPENAAVRARFADKLPAWRAAGGDDLIALERLLARNGGPPTDGPDREEYGRRGVAFGQKGNLCPFNEAGRCEIYPVRPNVCRAVLVLDNADHCVPGHGQPRRISHPMLDEAVYEAGERAARAADELGAVERALPEAVADASTRG